MILSVLTSNPRPGRVDGPGTGRYADQDEQLFPDDINGANFRNHRAQRIWFGNLDSRTSRLLAFCQRSGSLSTKEEVIFARTSGPDAVYLLFWRAKGELTWA